jgi:hypothetical protein
VGDTPVDFEDQLDEDEIAVLRDAGVLSDSTSRKRKSTSLKAPKHVIFTEDDSAGNYMPLFHLYVFSTKLYS